MTVLVKSDTVIPPTAVDIYPAVPNPITVLVKSNTVIPPPAVERYPADPKPSIVDCSVVSRNGVETRSVKETVERYPADPKPCTVEVRFAVERNPAV